MACSKSAASCVTSFVNCARHRQASFSPIYSTAFLTLSPFKNTSYAAAAWFSSSGAQSWLPGLNRPVGFIRFWYTKGISIAIFTLIVSIDTDGKPQNTADLGHATDFQ